MDATVLYWANRYLNASKRISVFRATSCSPTKMIRLSPPPISRGANSARHPASSSGGKALQRSGISVCPASLS